MGCGSNKGKEEGSGRFVGGWRSSTNTAKKKDLLVFQMCFNISLFDAV